MKNFFSKSLSSKFTIVVSAGIIPLVLVLLMIIYFVTENIIVDRIKKETEQKAAVISNNINLLFANTKIILTQLSNNEQIREYLKEVNSREKIRRNRLYKSVFETLNVTCDSDPLFNAVWIGNIKTSFYIENTGYISDENYSITKRPWFKKASLSYGFTFSYPYIDYTSNQMIISGIVPLREGNDLFGFVAADLFLTDLPKIFQPYKMGKKGVNFLLTGNGSFIFSDDPDKSINMKIFNDDGSLKQIPEILTQEKSGFLEVEYKRESYYLYFSKTPDNEWIIGSLISKNEALSDLNKFALLFLVSGLTITLLVIILIYKIMERELKPVSELKSLATDISKGGLPVKISNSLSDRNDELGEIAKSFSVISETFLKQNQSLEERLKENSAQIQMQYKYLIETEKTLTIGKLLAGVANQVCSPISLSSSIASSIEMITEENLVKLKKGDISLKEFESIMETVNDSAKILNSTLSKTSNLVNSFAQSFEKRTENEKTVFSVKENIKSAVNSFIRDNKSSRHQFHIDCDETLLIRSYPGLFALVFTNLISNSFNHAFLSKKDGNIFITASLDKEMLSIIYQDDGIGIPEENLNRIYEPFFSTGKQNGCKGLGMNIIFNIVTKTLGGDIACESSVGNGVKFTINVPLSADD